jgi:hypothetical protein
MVRLLLVALLCAVTASTSAQEPAADAPEAAPADAPATSPAEVPPAPASSARIVVVVRGGDPGADVIEAATALETQLAAAGLTLPADEGMRIVLRGGVPAAPEGYEPARAARLRLGWSPEADREALTGIGRFVEADAVVVVTGTDETIRVEVFDPGAGQFYEGAAAIAADDPSPAVAFVRTRARAALRRRIEPARAARAETPEGPARSVSAAGIADEPAQEQPRWIRRNWPIILAGVLLAGTVTYFVVAQRRDNNPDPPAIHIRPGGS